MAGRPKTMIRRVGQLEEVGQALACDVLEVCPPRYLDGYPDKPAADPIGRAWVQAAETAVATAEALERLTGLLRAKAGISEPGPAELPTACVEAAGPAPVASPSPAETGGGGRP